MINNTPRISILTAIDQILATFLPPTCNAGGCTLDRLNMVYHLINTIPVVVYIYSRFFSWFFQVMYSLGLDHMQETVATVSGFFNILGPVENPVNALCHYF